MAYTVKKSQPCVGCNEPTFRRARNSRDPLCIECATAKCERNAMQISQHAGEHYDAWLNGVAKFLRRQGTGTGVPITNRQPASRDT